MKQLRIWSLLAIYACASLAQAFPILKDVLEHVLFYQEHMQHVHHGHQHSDHVHHEVARILHLDTNNAETLSEIQLLNPNMAQNVTEPFLLSLKQPAFLVPAEFPDLLKHNPLDYSSSIFMPPEII